ncbi:hypothetical protein ES708_10949 [subsurface metagenome]
MALGTIDSLEFDTTLGATAKIIHISGDVYAIAYRGADNAGLLKTVSINSAGDIDSVLDTLIIDATYGTPGNIIHVSGDIYAIAYQGPDSVGWLATVEIDSAGDITDPVVDSQEFDILSGVSPRIIHISGTTYAITYAKAIGTGNKWRLWLKTISIADNGTIGAEVDSLEHDTGSPNALGSNIIHVSGDIYAIAHCSHIGGGWYRTCITTVDIDSVGNIADAVVEKYEIAVDSYYPIRIGRIIHIAGVVYAVVAGVYSPNGVFLYTFDISNAGDVGAVIASLEINLTHYQWSIPDIIKLPTDYAVACTDSGQYGRFKTIVIDDDGTIGEVTGILLFQVDKAHSPYMVSIASGITGIVYSGPDSDGWMKTIGVTPTVTTQAVSDIIGITATGNGNITDLGAPNPTAHGVCYNTTGWPRITDDKTNEGAASEIGAFTTNMTELVLGTSYYVRAYATNAAGTSYGNEVSFTTLVAIPSVISRAYALSREEL